MRIGNKQQRLIVMLCLLTAVLWAADEPADINPPAGGVRVLSPMQQRMQQVISVDFRQTPIDDVLRILAQQADVDIITSPKVEGTVTATLTDVPMGEALNNILQAHGYGYVTTDNMIRIMPVEEIVDIREKVVSEVFTITYADVKEVEAALKKFISDQGYISSNPGTSNIIVSDVESKVKAVASFIAQIDRITPQIMVEAKIYDISSKDRLDLGVDWQIGSATSYGQKAVGTAFGNSVSTLGNADSEFQTNPHATGLFSGTTNNTADTDALFRFGIISESLHIDTILRAAQEDIRAKLLANPRVMVLDNQQANIKIVEEIPYQELTQTAGGGSIGTTQFRDVGVELSVTPHLTRDGLIRLILNPRFKVRTGDVLPVASGSLVSPQPIIASRETKTTALIRDGQTVVIGGLRKQTVNQQTNKVPLLGDLPLLGGLFRFEGEETVDSELVVFITPSLIINHELTEDEQHALANTVFYSPRVADPVLKQNQPQPEDYRP